MGRSRPNRAGARTRAARDRHPEGRRVRHPRAQPPGMVALRLCARSHRRGRGSDLPVEHAGRVRIRPRARECGRLPRRRRAAREDRRRRARARPRARTPRRPARAGPRVPRGAPGGARRAGCGDRRGRPLHVHLHVGDDRAAEGLHDPQPQLLRHGQDDRRHRGLLPPDRRDAPLPAARPQLWAADAPARSAHGIHDRAPVRPAPDRRRHAAGSANHPPDGAARPGEGAHRGGRQLRVRHGRQAPSGRLGARSRTGGERPSSAARADRGPTRGAPRDAPARR